MWCDIFIYRKSCSRSKRSVVVLVRLSGILSYTGPSIAYAKNKRHRKLFGVWTIYKVPERQLRLLCNCFHLGQSFWKSIFCKRYREFSCGYGLWTWVFPGPSKYNHKKEYCDVGKPYNKWEYWRCPLRKWLGISEIFTYVSCGMEKNDSTRRTKRIWSYTFI